MHNIPFLMWEAKYAQMVLENESDVALKLKKMIKTKKKKTKKVQSLLYKTLCIHSTS